MVIQAVFVTRTIVDFFQSSINVVAWSIWRKISILIIRAAK